MMYPYITLLGELTTAFSEIMSEYKGYKGPLVRFFLEYTGEEDNVKEMEILLPKFDIVYSKGFSKEEIKTNIDIAKNNCKLVMRLAENGGQF